MQPFRSALARGLRRILLGAAVISGDGFFFSGVFFLGMFGVMIRGITCPARRRARQGEHQAGSQQ